MAAPNTHNAATPDGQSAGYARTGQNPRHNAAWVRFLPGESCDLTQLADDEWVVANVVAGGWDVYRGPRP